MKNIVLYITLLVNFGFSQMCFSQTPDLNNLHTLRSAEVRALLEQFQEKTPTSPDIVEHQWNFIFGKLFPDKRIYFGVDEFGKPCYLRIRQHAANNPEFAKVQAVIYYEAGKFSGETFENVGPVVRNGRFNRRLVNSIGAGWFSESKGGIWCPAQNVFIGGTRGTGRPTFQAIPTRNMCDEYEQFLQRPQPVSKFKK